MWIVALGVVALALGLAGLLLAPAMIEARRDAGMLRDSSPEITDEDRILATRGMGALFAVIGALLIGYGLAG
ncbi:hypothetical protein [Halovivax sp.]|uniref:hypothetical protein n=1 Tax=Halovivax sp. TaxID=1935978 RepID=UPI0025B84BE9|nr:hypothetical protein [Halovivax sp.]